MTPSHKRENHCRLHCFCFMDEEVNLEGGKTCSEAHRSWGGGGRPDQERGMAGIGCPHYRPPLVFGRQETKFYSKSGIARAPGLRFNLVFLSVDAFKCQVPASGKMGHSSHFLHLLVPYRLAPGRSPWSPSCRCSLHWLRPQRHLYILE